MTPRYFQKCPRCGKKAWEWLKRPKPGMPVTASGVVHSGNPQPGDQIRCQNCEYKLDGMEISRANLITEYER